MLKHRKLSVTAWMLPQKECEMKRLHPTVDSSCLRGLKLYQICWAMVQKGWCWQTGLACVKDWNLVTGRIEVLEQIILFIWLLYYLIKGLQEGYIDLDHIVPLDLLHRKQLSLCWELWQDQPGNLILWLRFAYIIKLEKV